MKIINWWNSSFPAHGVFLYFCAKMILKTSEKNTKFCCPNSLVLQKMCPMHMQASEHVHETPIPFFSLLPKDFKGSIEETHKYLRELPCRQPNHSHCSNSLGIYDPAFNFRMLVGKSGILRCWNESVQHANQNRFFWFPQSRSPTRQLSNVSQISHLYFHRLQTVRGCGGLFHLLQITAFRRDLRSAKGRLRLNWSFLLAAVSIKRVNQ